MTARSILLFLSALVYGLSVPSCGHGTDENPCPATGFEINGRQDLKDHGDGEAFLGALPNDLSQQVYQGHLSLELGDTLGARVLGAIEPDSVIWKLRGPDGNLRKRGQGKQFKEILEEQGTWLLMATACGIHHSWLVGIGTGTGRPAKGTGEGPRKGGPDVPVPSSCNPQFTINGNSGIQDQGDGNAMTEPLPPLGNCTGGKCLQLTPGQTLNAGFTGKVPGNKVRWVLRGPNGQNRTANSRNFSATLQVQGTWLLMASACDQKHSWYVLVKQAPPPPPPPPTVLQRAFKIYPLRDGDADTHGWESEASLELQASRDVELNSLKVWVRKTGSNPSVTLRVGSENKEIPVRANGRLTIPLTSFNIQIPAGQKVRLAFQTEDCELAVLRTGSSHTDGPLQTTVTQGGMIAGDVSGIQ